MKPLLLIVALTILAISGATSDEKDGTANSLENDLHTYTLIVVSSGENEVPIKGSIAYASDVGGYVHISGTTPFQTTVYGRSIITIVNSEILGTKIDTTLEVDGSPSVIGNDDQLVVFGNNMPKPNSGFGVSL